MKTSPFFQSIIIALALVVAFTTGYALGTRQLSQCQARNKALSNDLTKAVRRGVILETNLTLCQESKNVPPNH